MSQNLTYVTFADDNTLSSCGKMLGDTLYNPKFDLGHILKLFKVNSLKPNHGKFQCMILGTNTNTKVNLFLEAGPAWNNYWW